MHFTGRDIWFFVAYTMIFSALLLGYNIVSSPSSETTFNSASIRNKEEIVTAPVVDDEPKAVIASDTSLTISFNPENIAIDSALLDRLKENIDSPFFASKVTPLRLVLDAKRRDPRGQVVGNKLTLSTAIPNDSETLKVFVHELGHIVDISYLKK